MRESAMTEHVAVGDAEAKANRVEIRQRSHHGPRDPEARRYTGPPERGADREAGDRVRERRRHSVWLPSRGRRRRDRGGAEGGTSGAGSTKRRSVHLDGVLAHTRLEHDGLVTLARDTQANVDRLEAGRVAQPEIRPLGAPGVERTIDVALNRHARDGGQPALESVARGAALDLRAPARRDDDLE